MILEHRETGIRVVVFEYRTTTDHLSTCGRYCHPVTKIELLTGAGQPVIPSDPNEYQVLTDNGMEYFDLVCYTM